MRIESNLFQCFIVFALAVCAASALPAGPVPHGAPHGNAYQDAPAVYQYGKQSVKITTFQSSD